jgi:hypothetical protein
MRDEHTGLAELRPPWTHAQAAKATVAELEMVHRGRWAPLQCGLLEGRRNIAWWMHGTVPVRGRILVGVGVYYARAVEPRAVLHVSLNKVRSTPSQTLLTARKRAGRASAGKADKERKQTASVLHLKQEPILPTRYCKSGFRPRKASFQVHMLQ